MANCIKARITLAPSAPWRLTGDWLPIEAHGYTIPSAVQVSCKVKVSRWDRQQLEYSTFDDLRFASLPTFCSGYWDCSEHFSSLVQICILNVVMEKRHPLLQMDSPGTAALSHSPHFLFPPRLHRNTQALISNHRRHNLIFNFQYSSNMTDHPFE